jgi:hypothetical protein
MVYVALWSTAGRLQGYCYRWTQGVGQGDTTGGGGGRGDRRGRVRHRQWKFTCRGEGGIGRWEDR